MAKYLYPAVFTEENVGYSVHFPDLENCYTQGDDLIDALEMAEDALALVLFEYEREEKVVPEPTDIDKVDKVEGEIVTLVKADTMMYRKRYGSKSVKKTLTIPEWLNEEAGALDINFSKVLQEALIQKINLR